MSVVEFQSSRAVSVKIVTIYRFKSVKDEIIIEMISCGLTRAYRTMFKSKQALVCKAKLSNRRFDWLREILPFEPLLIFSTERISHHAPKENTKIEIPLHKKSTKKKEKLRLDICYVESRIYVEQGSDVRAQTKAHSSGMEANRMLHLNPWRATLSTALPASGSFVSSA
jgi:hypothetical protein